MGGVGGWVEAGRAAARPDAAASAGVLGHDVVGRAALGVFTGAAWDAYAGQFWAVSGPGSKRLDGGASLGGEVAGGVAGGDPAFLGLGGLAYGGDGLFGGFFHAAGVVG